MAWIPVIPPAMKRDYRAAPLSDRQRTLGVDPEPEWKA
jgi:hypothetical protein